MLEQMDVTESSWPGPVFMEPMFPSAPTPAPTPSSMPMDDSAPSSKPKAKAKPKKKKAAKKARPKPKKKPEKKKRAAKKNPRRYHDLHHPPRERLHEALPRRRYRRQSPCAVRPTPFCSRSPPAPHQRDRKSTPSELQSPY